MELNPPASRPAPARPAAPAHAWLFWRNQAPSWAVLLGVGATVLYLIWLPFIERTWRPTGDEPHYLLAAHSLTSDYDFDLANNYDRLDYLAFYFSQDISRQIRLNQADQEILNHSLGLPLLIAPAYALGGRAGVLAFQAVLGGLLAWVSFKLALAVSGDRQAALLATLAVILTPPLLMYHYLVYPELIGALLTTLLLYFALTRRQASPALLALTLFSLALLPWLNRRFVPLALLLAGLLLWAWRSPHPLPGWQSETLPWPLRPLWNRLCAWAGRPTLTPLLGLLAASISIGALLWFDNQFQVPPRVDIIAPADGSVLWYRLVRGAGWLVDQQRGLFVFGPVYILALWGIPPLLRLSLKHERRDWFILTPFLLSLVVTAVAGGFWVPWELGPRFLVVGLPALTPLFALAWIHYRRYKLWVGLAVVLFGLSLSNSWQIIHNPEMPYKSSLPLFYGEKSGLPLTEWLPDLAGYARIFAAEADPTINQTVRENGELFWFAEAGKPRNVAQSGPLGRLPFGHYRLTWPVRVEPNLPPETPLLRISTQFLGGGVLFNHTITAGDLPADGSFGLIEHYFINSNVDRWRTPLIFNAVSSGESNIWGRDITLSPQPFYAFLLPYLYLAVFVVAAAGSWTAAGRFIEISPGEQQRPGLAGKKGLRWSLLLLLLIGGSGYLFYQASRPAHTYEAADLYHFAGRAIADPAAEDGRAWLVDPAVDPPQKATHGPFDIYDAGQYQVTFRIKAPEALPAEEEVGRLQVNATANLEELVTQPLLGKHFSQPDLYHDFVLTITNPRRQALSFELHYLGVAPLVIDQVTIAPAEK